MSPKNNTQESIDSALVTVTLIAPHSHAGERFQKNDTIKVTLAQADWLKTLGIIAQDTHTHTLGE
ncbi:DUF7210 family protein [Methylomonas rapida]|uniref:DUF7210 domain-containing protein n=1 Tax=Methylomonas rapida TaxID=2963939 RepID=A0ABY7GGM0_9GAMM|nr:hypothetical protein [Methylomonas rapida]WAR42933.1 hypothetical protein NM686_011015 [Methylomonas rapida]